MLLPAREAARFGSCDGWSRWSLAAPSPMHYEGCSERVLSVMGCCIEVITPRGNSNARE
jgi:hypothetical protein